MAQDSIKLPTKTEIRRAGDILRNLNLSGEEKDTALELLSHWRALYFRPINTIQALIRKKINNLNIKSAIVAQRLKRTPSIISKLQRFSSMQLDQMQDIGGIRAVVNSVSEVQSLHASLIKGRHKHSPVIPPKDYIAHPKPDGYRGIHQVFRYGTTQPGEPNGMLIEVQIRTNLQHYWATAVETLSLIEKSSFKTGMGEEKFKHFFRLSSALFAIHEQAPIVESLSEKSPREIVDEFEKLEAELGVFDKLAAFTSAVKVTQGVENKTANGYYLLMLNTEQKSISFIPFSSNQGQLAEQFYMLMEKELPDVDVVLAAAGDLKGLRHAYPNYFVDTKAFMSNLSAICRNIKQNHEYPSL